MADKNEKTGIKQYADGWITEREGTPIPGFLKLAFPIIAGSSILYLIVYMYGETTNADRGALVQKFNEVTQTSPGLMYAVAALAAVFAVIVVSFAFRKSH
jgi:hypothetical protein